MPFLDTLGPTGLAVIAILGVFVGFGIFRGRKRAQEAERQMQALRQDAETRGWQFDGQRRGSGTFLTFSGTSGGLAWRLETLSNSHTDSDTASNNYSRWRSDSVSLPGEVVLLVPRLRHAVQLGALSVGGDNPLARAAKRAFIKNVLHEDPAEAKEFDRVQAIETGSEPLRESYMVMATDDIAASRFLNRQAETTLLEFSAGDNYHIEARIGAVIFWKNGLGISFTRAVLDPEEIAEIARFGAALAGRSQSD